MAATKETWAQRIAREKRELDAAIPEALRQPDDRLRARLEGLARTHRDVFAEFLPRWGPAAWHRDRIRFRPLILAHAADGWWSPAWKGQAKALQTWLGELEAAGDDELFRTLYPHMLAGLDATARSARWRRDLLARWNAPGANRARVLTRFDIGGLTLDEATALVLWEADPARARAFVLRHLPFRTSWLGSTAPERWKELPRRCEHRDPDLFFALYRAQTPGPTWHQDVLALADAAGPALDEDLERRHVARFDTKVAPTYTALLERAGLAAWPYVQRHLASLQHQEAGAPALLDLVWKRGWVLPWAAVAVRTGHVDTEAARALADRTLGDAEVHRRLTVLGTSGRGFAVLSESTALRLHTRFPDLLRGPLRGLLPRHGEPKALLAALLEAQDTAVIDDLASAFVLRHYTKGGVLPRLVEHYAALPPAELARRGAAVLSGVPAFAIHGYDHLVRQNPLARLLLERSDAWLLDGDAVRDLLESPNIQVQGVALRLLGRDDPRARAIAVQCLDLLLPTLLRRLHTRTRRWAITALGSAGVEDRDAARRIVPAARDAMDLPGGRYPKEELAGLLGRLLHRWPELRTSSEVPRVYRAEAS